jgi:hypothetical protein
MLARAGQYTPQERAYMAEKMPDITADEENIANQQALSERLRGQTAPTKRMDWASQGARALSGVGAGLAHKDMLDTQKALGGKVRKFWGGFPGMGGGFDSNNISDPENFMGYRNWAMDPYLLNSTGLGAEDDPELALPPLARQRAAAANVRQPYARPELVAAHGPGDAVPFYPLAGVPSTPAQTAQVSPPTAAAAPTPSAGDKARTLAYDVQRQANEAATTMPDMTEQAARYRQGYEAAGPDMAVSMMLGQLGGRMGREMAPQVFKAALANRQKQVTPYGTLDYEGGFTADPMKEREFKVSRLEKQAQLYETMARDADTSDDRRRALLEAERAHKAAEQQRQDNLNFQNRQLGVTAAHYKVLEQQGKFSTFKDAEGNVGVIDTRTGKLIGQGGGGIGGAPGDPGERFPKLNDSQGKAVAFGMRAAQAAQRWRTRAPTTRPHPWQRRAGWSACRISADWRARPITWRWHERALAEQAQRNFVNAILAS